MTYQVLARKYRPQDFSSVVGQQPIVTALRNAVTEGRIAQAYLFSGIRGVGKTSVARILAKAVNCENGPAADPCNECVACTEITSGSDIDFIEVDAATHSKVEQVRELAESLKYGAARDRYKVVVVDEIHRLSRQAFDALLKIVEEPPPHLVFIFATTEIDAVPATILSRCQEFRFRRVPSAELAEHLRTIAEAESIEATDTALRLVARAGDGSVRDSVALLDQLATFGSGTVPEDEAARILGGVDHAVCYELLRAILEGDSGGVTAVVQSVEEEGWDPRHVFVQFLGYARDALHLALDAAGVELPEEEAARLAELAKQSGYENLLRVLNQLLSSEMAVRQSETGVLAVEIAWLRATELPKLVAIEELLAGGGAPSGAGGGPAKRAHSGSPPPARRTAAKSGPTASAPKARPAAAKTAAAAAKTTPSRPAAAPARQEDNGPPSVSRSGAAAETPAGSKTSAAAATAAKTPAPEPDAPASNPNAEKPLAARATDPGDPRPAPVAKKKEAPPSAALADEAAAPTTPQPTPPPAAAATAKEASSASPAADAAPSPPADAPLPEPPDAPPSPSKASRRRAKPAAPAPATPAASAAASPPDPEPDAPPPSPSPAASSGSSGKSTARGGGNGVETFFEELSRRKQPLAAQLSEAHEVCFKEGRLEIHAAPDDPWLNLHYLQRDTNQRAIDASLEAVWGPGTGWKLAESHAPPPEKTAPPPPAAVVEVIDDPRVQTVLDIFGGTVESVTENESPGDDKQ